MNGSEAQPPEHGPFFTADTELVEAIEELLADQVSMASDQAGPATTARPESRTWPRPPTDPQRDRRVAAGGAIRVIRVDLPGLAAIAARLGSATAERFVPKIEEALARAIRRNDRVVRIGPTTQLVLVTGDAAAVDGIVTRLEVALEGIGGRGEPVVRIVPRGRDAVTGREAVSGPRRRPAARPPG